MSPWTRSPWGLVVDGQADGRTDRDLSNQAARLLADLHAEFGDWGLALAAYKQGPGAVRAAIAAEGSRDITTLMEAGALHGAAAAATSAAVGLAAIGRSGITEGFAGPLSAGLMAVVSGLSLGLTAPDLAAHLPIASLVVEGAAPGLPPLGSLVAGLVDAGVFAWRSRP